MSPNNTFDYTSIILLTIENEKGEVQVKFNVRGADDDDND